MNAAKDTEKTQIMSAKDVKLKDVRTVLLV